MDHVEDVHVRVHLGSSGDDDGCEGTSDDVPEGIDVPGVADLDDIRTQLGGGPGAVGDLLGRVENFRLAEALEEDTWFWIAKYR